MSFVPWGDVPAARVPGSGPWVIYALVDPRDETVRYVGVTIGSLEARLDRHVRRPTNDRVRAWLGEIGVRPHVRALHSPRDRWEDAERGWIAWFRARGDLLNADPGGICRTSGGAPIARKMVPPRDWNEKRVKNSLTWKQKRAAAKLASERAAVARLSGPVRRLSREEIAKLYPPK